LVEATATTLSIPLALELLRLSFGLSIQNDEVIVGLKRQLKSDGVNYARATQSLELILIGDCVLLHSLEKADSKLLWSHVILACALVCQQSLRTVIRHPVQVELLRRARQLVDRLAVQWRRNAHKSMPKIDATEIQVGQIPEEVKLEIQEFNLRSSYVNEAIKIPVPNVKQINGIVASVVSAKKNIAAIATQTAALSTAVNGLFDSVRTAIAAPQEENNIHWYLLGETSRDLHRRFASLDLAELVLVAAKELADLTETVPGLFAALAFLERLLRQGRSAEAAAQPLSIEQVVSASQSQWKQKGIQVVGFEATQDLTPILCSLSYATTGDTDWRAMTTQLCNVDLTRQISPLLLSYQLYQEILLSRLASQQLAAGGEK
jgi:hypothetical protein